MSSPSHDFHKAVVELVIEGHRAKTGDFCSLSARAATITMHSVFQLRVRYTSSQQVLHISLQGLLDILLI